jgi:2-methylcitrate dehydratase PrpD
MSGNEKIADFVVTARWEGLPEPVRCRLRMCLMDNLSATLSGKLAKVSQIAAKFACQQGSAGRASILLNGKKAAPALAAFANASAANALDTDDGLQYAYGHAGAQVFPAALALAEALDLDGGRLMAAMAVGYEVAARVGRCWHDHHVIYQACGSWGAVACAAVAANLTELSKEQTTQALGIAEFFAPNVPMMRDVDHPGMVKHGIGWGAMTGIMSAELASLGYTGIQGIAGIDKYRDWVADIGENFILTEGVVWKTKDKACCAWAHAAMKGAKRVVVQNKLRLEDIDRIRVEGFHETVRLGTTLPSTTEEAQFNLAWPVAAMLVDGEVGPKQMLEDRLGDPLIRDLARKVEVVETEELNELHRLFKIGDKRGRFASKVAITLKDGKRYESGLVDEGLRFPQTDWNEKRIEDKFRHLAGYVMDKNRIDRLIDIIWRFEEIKKLDEFIGILINS